MDSDLKLNLTAFQQENIEPSTLSLNKRLDELCEKDVKWWQCGIDEYRRRRAAGETPFPPPTVLPNGREFEIPTPDGRHLKFRVFGENISVPKGVFYHIHGGGYVLGSASGQDLLLDMLSRRTDMVIVSIDYRLAPEHPYPAARVDCCIAAEWLLDHCQEKWGCELKIIGGESAGATLSALVLLHLRDIAHTNNTVCGAVLSYGNYDISGLPAMRDLNPANSTLLSWPDCEQFSTASIPGMDCEMRKQPGLSPAYNDLVGLPSALFLCGTADGMVDDQFLMSAKWQIAGNEAVVRFVPGACHGFMTFDGNKVTVTKQGWDIAVEYVNYRLGLITKS